MKGLKKTLRLVGVVLLILMASVGIGLAGGAPMPMFRRRENTSVAIELFECHGDKLETVSEVYKP